MTRFHRLLLAASLPCLTACGPSQGHAPAPIAEQRPLPAAAQTPPATIAPPVIDDGSGPDADAPRLPTGPFHGNWRVAAADDPHDQALMAISIQSNAGEAQGSGDYVLFQPFCDALDDAPITGTSGCEAIGQGAAFERVETGPDRLVLVFRPTADGAEHRLELRRAGTALAGDYVAEANDIRRALRVQRGIDE